MIDKRIIYDLSFDEMSNYVEAMGESAFRSRQIWEGIYKHLVDVPDQMSNLPKMLRQELEKEFAFNSFQPIVHLISEDGFTEKALLQLNDGHEIETVLMRYDRRRTACISTQSGCAIGCSFCATGQMGFGRNLSSGEIIDQVLYISRRLSQQDERLSNIVLMGMGEPFHNYDATMDAIDRITDSRGFGFGARRITISTVGLVPMIKRFTTEESQVNLAVSLHGSTNEVRDQLVPINKQYPLEQLIPACRDYVDQTNRRVTFEWALISNVNDGIEQAEELARLVQGIICHVNIIRLNPTNGYDAAAPSRKKASAFRDILVSNGIPCTIRVRRGIDIHAGCGQLAGHKSC